LNPVNFPLFRKTLNGKSFYKIHNERHLEELQIIGSKYLHHTLQAKIYPEILFLLDIIENKDQAYLEISASEFDTFEAYCKTELTPISA
jgi:hypothetical protein